MTPSEEIVYHIGKRSLYSHITKNLGDSEKGSQLEESIDSKVENEVLIGTEEQEPGRRDYFNNGYSETKEIETKKNQYCSFEDLGETVEAIAKDKYGVVLTVDHKRGLHMTPCGIIAKKAIEYDSSVLISEYSEVNNYEEVSNDAKSVSQILCSAVENKKKVIFVSEGPDSKEALESMKDLFENNFYLKD